MDLSALESMKYSGRAIVIGMTPEGQPFVNYTLTGRSSSSKARVLKFNEDTGIVYTEPTDEEALKKGNPALLVYNAIIPTEEGFIISNGAQTDLVIDSFKELRNKETPLEILMSALENPSLVEGIDLTAYEPDSPIFTPRITGILQRDRFAFGISRRDHEGNTNRVYPEGKLETGKAFMISTYKGGNELPTVLPFEGNSPLELLISINSVQHLNLAFAEAIKNKKEDFSIASATYFTKSPLPEHISVANRKNFGWLVFSK